MKLHSKIFFIIGIAQCALLLQGSLQVSQAVEPPTSEGYTRIMSMNVDTIQKLQYLRNYHTRAQTCYVDASILAVQYYYDSKMSTNLSAKENEYDPKPYALSNDCLELSSNMKANMFFTQYQICSAMAKLDGSDSSFGICEGLGKKPAEGLPAYSYEYSEEERTAIKEQIKNFRAEQMQETQTATQDVPAEIPVPGEDNPLTILRFRLFYETRNYKNTISSILSNVTKNAATNASTGLPTKNVAIVLQGLSLSAYESKEGAMASMVDQNMLEWYQEFFLSYPQHLQYTYIKKQLNETAKQFNRIARVIDQLRYKIPNSSVDGDKNKGK